jgi:hypothetical protein
MRSGNTIERAFELARSGDYKSITDLERQLRAEHYDAVAQHLQGSRIRKELQDLMRAAKTQVSISMKDASALA